MQHIEDWWYIQTHFHNNIDVHSYETRNRENLHYFSYNMQVASKRIRHSMPNLINLLPADVRLELKQFVSFCKSITIDSYDANCAINQDVMYVVTTEAFVNVNTGLPRVREKFFSGKFWKGANVREMSGNFMWGFWKVCHVMIFIHKITWFSNCKLNFSASWLITLFPVVLVSSKSYQIWQMAFQVRKSLWVLSFCLIIPGKSMNFSSEMFNVVYFFEARINTLLLYVLSSDF